MDWKRIINAFFVFAAMLVAATIPLSEIQSIKWNSVAIWILIGAWILTGDYKGKYQRLKENKIFWIFISPFLWNVFGLIYSDDVSSGTRYVVLNLSLILIPLILATSPSFTTKQVKYILLAFTVSVIICTFYLFKDGFDYTFGNWYNPHIITIKGRQIIGRIYCSIYLTLILFTLYFDFFSSKNAFSLRNVLIFLITAYIIYLNGILIVKTTIISTVVIAVVLLGIYLLKAKKLLHLSSLLLICLLTPVTLYFCSPRVSYAFDKVIHAQPIEVSGSGINFEMNSFSTRLVIWESAREILSDNNNWLAGVGPGDDRDALKNKYAQKGLSDNLYLDVHNEYLQTLLRNGIIGLVLLLFCLIAPFKRAFSMNNYLHMSFLLLTFFCLFTESWFGRQAGIVFYSFFNSLLFFGGDRD